MIWMAVGAAISILGKYGANVAQAMSETRNAEFYREQAQLSEFTKNREISLVARNYSQQYGQRLSAYAGGGVDLSGSAEAVAGIVSARYLEEELAITKKYDLEKKLGNMRADNAQSNADTLGSAGYNLTQAGTTALNAYTSYQQGWGGSGGSTNVTNYYGSGPMSPSGGSSSYLTGSSGGGSFMSNSYLTGSSGGF